MIVVRIHVQRTDNGALPRPELLTILRAQITLLRHQYEGTLSLTIGALGRAERIARSLELQEATRA
jgi:hypothetical protein